MGDEDGRAEAISDCGHDRIEVFVKLRGGRVDHIWFEFRGCQRSLACARAATELARDRAVAEARRAVNTEAISAAVGGLSDDHLHCAELAEKAVKDALLDAVLSEREPWRKMYRR